MLEKMGWAEGKGLGAKEDGSTDPVTVSYKWDNKGMGFKGADGDEAVAQQKDFDALLATLSQDSSPDKKSRAIPDKSPKSLELMSQKSRARVHYHKFTRGKDLSRASSKDLASILGMATEVQTSTPASTGPIVTPDVGPPIEQNLVTTFGITTIARGNINEYFKQKFEERKRKMAGLETEDCSKKICNPDETTNGVVTETNEPINDNINPDNTIKKKKKKKKNKNDDESVIECDSSTVLNDTLLDAGDLSTSKSRRKSVTWGDVEVSFVSKYIKEMVDTSSDSVCGESDTLVTAEAEDTSSTVGKKKKKKDKKKSKDEFAYESIEPNSEVSEVVAEESNSPGKKKKKKKRNKESSLCTDERTNYESQEDSGAELINGLGGTEREDPPIKKKKKKTTDKQEENRKVVDSSESLEAAITTDTSLKKQKKKKLKMLSEDIHVFPESNDQSECDNDNALVSTKKMKNKSRQIDYVDDTASDKIVDNKSKKRKRRECDESILDHSVDGNPQPEEYLQAKKKKKRKKEILESDSCPEIPLLGQNGNDNVSSEVPTDTNSNNKVKKKKSKNSIVDSEIALGDSETVPNVTEQPALSALTQERMAKWKDRRKTKDGRNPSGEMVSDSCKIEMPKTAKIEYNPNQPTQDYNHRKVLSALGYNVKGAIDKTITVRMPESNFSGSNLDAIPGYGQTIKTC